MAATPMTAAMVTAALEATAAKIKPNETNPVPQGRCCRLSHAWGRTHRSRGFRGNRRTPAEPDPYFVRGQSDDIARSCGPGARCRAAKACQPGRLWPRLYNVEGPARTSRLMWAKRSQEYLAKINTGNPARWPKWFAICSRPATVPAAASANAICSSLRWIVLPASSPPSDGSPSRTRSSCSTRRWSMRRSDDPADQQPIASA